ncbi:MAG: hypothetical protein KCHDKBKB_01846 [Elusimicrobia bacterium]|nr:hypothetical protein [Elusimicrobiota bacterium]
MRSSKPRSDSIADSKRYLGAYFKTKLPEGWNVLRVTRPLLSLINLTVCAHRAAV